MGKKRFSGYFSTEMQSYPAIEILNRPPCEVVAEVIRGLAGEGFVVLKDLLSRDYREEVRREILEAKSDDRFKKATVGKRGENGGAEGRALHPEIRGDGTLWFEPSNLSPAQAQLWGFLEALRSGLNRELFLGLWDLEGHYAIYPPGAFYRKHLDRFRDDSKRTVSVVAFFNPDWRDREGGSLVLDLPKGPLAVAPEAGTMVFFLSDRIPHEVAETTRERLSFAGWFRTRS